MTEEEPSFWGPISFNPSPYSVNWERLHQAGNCVRKLCLIYLDVPSDRRRKMKQAQDDGLIQATIKPSIPLDQPSATALGEVGEQSVAQSMVDGLVDISDDFHPEHWRNYPDFGEVDYGEREEIEYDDPSLITPDAEIHYLADSEYDYELLLPSIELEHPKPPIAQALEKSWNTVCSSVVAYLDMNHADYILDPFNGLVFTETMGIDELQPDLLGYIFDDVYQQTRVSSSAVLLRGIVDFLAITPDGSIVPIEVKNSASPSGKDRFQLLTYLNALNTGGAVSKRPPLNIQFEEITHKYMRIRNLSRSITYKAAEELGNRLMRMAHRRNLEYQSIAQLEYENGLRIRSLASEILSQSKVFSLLRETREGVESQYSIMKKALMKQHTKTFTKGALNSIKEGLLVYPRVGETYVVKSNEVDFKPFLQSWIGCVLAVNRGEALPIPDNAPCGRCGYKQACKEYHESELPEVRPKPVPILFEAVDKRIPNTDVLTKSNTKRLVEHIRHKKMKQYIQTRLVEDDALGLSMKVAKDWKGERDQEIGSPFFGVSFEVRPVVSSILTMKIVVAIEDNDLLGQNLRQWGSSNIESDAAKYYRRRPSAMYERANVALRYWKV